MQKNWWDDDETVQPAPAQAGAYPPGAITVGRPKPKEAPAGYRYDATGNLQAIPGGPAEKPTLPVGWQMGPGGKAVRIPGLPGDPSEVTPHGDISKVGEDYLKTLPPTDAALIPMLRAMSDGRQGMPSNYRMGSPQAMQLLAEAHQYDPTLDAANLPGRIAAYKGATSGQLGRKINTYNTALGHMQSMAQAVEDLHDFGGDTALTSVANYARNSWYSNRPELSRFTASRKAVADELTKAFADAGGSLADREHWLEIFNENKSPKALRAAIAEAAGLLGSKIQASEDQYNSGMGTTGHPLPLLNPHARDALGMFQRPDYLDKGYGAIAPHGGGQGGGGQGGGPGGTPPTGPLDPSGSGDIGFNQPGGGLPPGAQAAQKDIQAAILSGTLRTPEAIIGYAKGKYNLDIKPEEAKAAAEAVLKGGGVSVQTPQYSDKLERDRAHQALIDSQNITDVRGGKPLESLDAGVRGGANSLTWGLADKGAALFGPNSYDQNLARQEKIGQYDSQHHFMSQLTGSALGLMGNEAGAAKIVGGAGQLIPRVGNLTSKIPEAMRPLINDASYGAIYGGVNTDGSAGDRALGAIEGAGATALGGMAGRAVGRGAGRVLTGSRDAATQALTKAGIPLTIGQIAGKGGFIGRTAKSAEDALESLPILGAAIKSRRQEGISAFDRATFDHALEPIKDTTKGQVGEQGVESARTAIGNAYSKALDGVNISFNDPIFARNLSRVIGQGQKLHPEVAKDFEGIVRDELAPVIAKGNMSGDDFQALKQVIAKERADWAGQPRGRKYGNVLTQIDNTLESLVRRQAPETVPALKAANAAYRQSKVVEDAVARGANSNGLFTPAQLGMAAKQSGKKYGNSAATTDRPFFDLQRAGQEVLPSTMGNSGTFDRAAYGALVPAALGGVGYESGMSPEHVGAMMVLGLPFTKAGQAAFQKLLVERPDVVRKAGQNLITNPRSRGLFGSAGVYGAAPAINGLLSD